MTHFWIKRSGELPLTLRLHVRLNGGFQALRDALMNAITSYTSRWEHVELNFLISLPHLGNMPCLRTFAMILVPKDAQFPFSSCPKLTSVYWSSNRTISSAPLPWYQLTHIQLSNPLPARELFFIVQSCSKLADLEVTLSDDVHEYLSSCEMVINRSLRKLQLDDAWFSGGALGLLL